VVSAAVVRANAAPTAAPSLQTIVDSVTRAVRYAAAQFVNGVFGPLVGAGPLNGSDQSSVLYAVVAWARREIDKVIGVTAATTDSLTMSDNLIVNPGAEVGASSATGVSTVTMPGWTVTGIPTVVKYGTLRNLWPVGLSFAWPNLPSFLSYPSSKQAPPDSGEQFFSGGLVADATLSQVVDLTTVGSDIDTGTVNYNLSGWLGGYQWWNASAASVTVNFLDKNGGYISRATIGPVTPLDRLFGTGFRERDTSGVIPVGTRSAQIVLNLDQKNPVGYGTTSGYNDAYADNLSFTISAPIAAPPAPTPPPVTIGQLDHVILVYGENKGADDVLNGGNGPFFNSLVNAYGSYQSYYAFTHPSLPNYYPVIAGVDPGKTYNCDGPCIAVGPDELVTNTLVNNLDLAGKSWRGYAQSQPPGQPLQSSGDYSTDQLPFVAFEGIGDNQAYAEEHLFPLTQMFVDLQSPETTPAFSWFAANEDNNGEGPVSGLSGALKFIISYFGHHQYNVPAIDTFIQENVTAIMNSNVWNDPNEKSAIFVTFDEDNNNINLGGGNEGNHIIMVGIPSPGAVAAGMRSGHFVVTDQAGHYNLLRTIEDSLGITTRLSENDTYATALNGFWT
jgi:hypothetical protein